MAVVVVPVAEGIAALAAATLSALAARELARATQVKPNVKERHCAETPEETECKQCKLGSGRLDQAREPRFITEKNLINYRYQLYIANLFAAPERFVLTRFRDAENKEVSVRWERVKDLFRRSNGSLTTTEWFYNGIWFDGFWRRFCTVVEAKGNYDWMFPESPKRGPDFARFVVDEWAQSYEKQRAVVSVGHPCSRLEWHFMQEQAWLQARRIGIDVAKFTPFTS